MGKEHHKKWMMRTQKNPLFYFNLTRNETVDEGNKRGINRGEQIVGSNTFK